MFARSQRQGTRLYGLGIDFRYRLAFLLGMFVLLSLISCNVPSSDDDDSSTDDDNDDDSIDDDSADDDTGPQYHDDLVRIWDLVYGINVELSNGAGTFTEAQIVGSTTGGFYNLAAGDFDGNGCVDLVSMGITFSFSLLVNNCHGDLDLREVETNGYWLNYAGEPTAATADVNQDGCLDAVFVIGDDNGFGEYQKILVVYYGNCAGGFSYGDERTLASPPTSIALGDFNDDSFPDAAIGFRDGGGVFLGSGEDFHRSAAFSETIWRVTLGDFNNDGKLDVLGSKYPDIYLYLGHGDGTFGEGLLLGDSAGACATGDFNSDGNLDFVSALSDAQTIRVLLGDGTGTFEMQDFLLCEWTNTYAIGDFNRDGFADVAASCRPYESDEDPILQNQQVNILFGDGDGTFQDPIGTGFSADYLIAEQFDNE